MKRSYSQNRRQFLHAASTAAWLPMPQFLLESVCAATRSPAAPRFKTRGVVLRVDDDLSSLSVQWPKWATAANLTTIGTHITPKSVLAFLKTDEGFKFLDECKRLGLEVEHELHAMGELLPRNLFAKDPTMFRMNRRGERVPDANCCVHSPQAVEIICENASRYARVLRPTTGRYFFWMDDNQPACCCPDCRVYSASDQAVILENELLESLRQVDERASLAHLAYLHTMSAPFNVRPADGLFLEFAPIRRSFRHPLRDLQAKGEIERLGVADHKQVLEWLDANLEVFPRGSAQALEYWLDVSLFSGWKRPAVKLPWRPDVVQADLEVYASRGIRHITSFANFVDQDYVKRYGHPEFIDEYGALLSEP